MRRGIRIIFVSLRWFGHGVIVETMDDPCVESIPEMISVLTPNCHNSDISTMSKNEEDNSDRSDNDSESGSVDNPAHDSKALFQKLKEMERENKKRNQVVADLMKQLEDSKQAKKVRVEANRTVTNIKDLARANTLPEDKQISLRNYLRDVVFRGLKLVTKDVIKCGSMWKWQCRIFNL